MNYFLFKFFTLQSRLRKPKPIEEPQSNIALITVSFLVLAGNRCGVNWPTDLKVGTGKPPALHFSAIAVPNFPNI
jgi:hypothetical protein